MKAVVFEQYKSFPALREIDEPTAGPGEVLLKVAGSGVCHSDVTMYRDFDEASGPSQLGPPFVLGHEISGWVESVGAGVAGIEKGEAHLVYGPSGCGRSRACLHWASLPSRSSRRSAVRR